MSTRVAVALSGGVDSTVSAALLKDEGFEVFGLTAKTWPSGSRCCSDEDIRSARRVCDRLGIPHYVVDLSDAFETRVVAYFIDEYLAGRTPLPCARCNRHIKFGVLMQRAMGLGAEALATGHYARLERAEGRIRLLRGVDRAKDQSYFLFDLSQDQLARTRFPVGGMEKSQVVALARERRLPAHERRESQDLCFVAEGEHAALIEQRVPERVRSGDVIDVDGRCVGRHGGVHRFTIGQRRGLGVAAGEPRYVARLDPDAARVHLAGRTALLRRTAGLTGVRWTSGLVPTGPVRVEAKTRYRQALAPAQVVPDASGGAALQFDEAQFAITPGQVAVFYQGDELVGGGWIESAL